MRLFVALNLPETIRHDIRDATANLREERYPFRWIEGDALHLTLSFLGEVAETRVPELMSTLSTAATRHATFSFRLKGVGAFPNLRRPRVLWLGVENDGSLERLQDDVAGALEPLGFERERRAYSPHLTLARAKNDASPAAFASLAAGVADFEFERTVNVETIDLMRSHLSSAGARYERVGAAPLGSRTSKEKR